MRLLSVLLILAGTMAAQSVPDPAKLKVTASDGSLTYKIINQSPYPIVGFEVRTQFTSGGFEAVGCMVSADVKTEKDLTVSSVCRVPNDENTGKPVTYFSRIVRVKFENGLEWTPPAKESENEKTLR